MPFTVINYLPLWTCHSPASTAAKHNQTCGHVKFELVQVKITWSHVTLVNSQHKYSLRTRKSWLTEKNKPWNQFGEKRQIMATKCSVMLKIQRQTWEKSTRLQQQCGLPCITTDAMNKFKTWLASIMWRRTDVCWGVNNTWSLSPLRTTYSLLSTPWRLTTQDLDQELLTSLLLQITRGDVSCFYIQRVLFWCKALATH